MFEGRLPFLAFATLSIAVILTLFTFPGLWEWFLGPIHYDPPLYPFLDMHGRLAHMEMHAKGWDVYEARNPIDPLHRVNNKPRITLVFGQLGLSTQHLVPVSVFFITTFLIAVLRLIRPWSWPTCLVGLACVLSPPVLLLIERANDDIILFSCLAPLPFLLASRNRWLWIGALGIIFLVTPVKFYPIAVLSAFLYRPGSRYAGLAFFLTGVSFALAYVAINVTELVKLSGRVPSPNGYLTFGAETLFRDLGMETAGVLFPVIALTCLILVCLWIVFRDSKGSALQTTGHYSEYAFLIGIAVLTFCFFLNSNWDYRMAYFLFAVPFILKMAHSPEGGTRLTGRLMLVLLMASLFLEYLFFTAAYAYGSAPLRYIFHIHIIRQIVLWALMAFSILTCAHLLRPSIQATFGLRGVQPSSADSDG